MNQDLVRQQPGDIAPPSPRMPVPRIAPDLVRPRLPELGRIRLGEKRTTKTGKEYPAKLETFRFTSRDEALMQIVAEKFGGEVTPWMSDEGPQFQVYSEATSLEVVVPKAELAFSQWFENWEGHVCNRRCNGHWETVKDVACYCEPISRKCLPTTRLNVFLPDVPGMGVWRVESHGFNAAAEILGTIELAALSGATLLPAKLKLTARTKWRRNLQTQKVETNRFIVPVLVIDKSLMEMVAEQDAIRRRTLGVGSMYERADEGRMRALRTAVFTRWPESVNEPERTRRLAQLSEMLGRPVATLKAEEHDLTMRECILLTDTVDSLPDELGEPARQIGPRVAGADEPARQTDSTLTPSADDWIPAPAAADPYEWAVPEGAGEEDVPPGAGETTLGEVRTSPAPAEQLGLNEDELVALRDTLVMTVRQHLMDKPKKWMPWFRLNGPAVHGAAWATETFPTGWTGSELQELLRRIEKEESL